MSKALKIICSVLGCILGLVIGYRTGILINGFLNTDFALSKGLWSVEAGAPSLAIKAVEFLPAILGAVGGIVYSVKFKYLGVLAGAVIGLISAPIVGILSYVTCLIIGSFITGIWLPLLVILALFAELFFPVKWILIIIPFKN